MCEDPKCNQHPELLCGGCTVERDLESLDPLDERCYDGYIRHGLYPGIFDHLENVSQIDCLKCRELIELYQDTYDAAL